MVVSELPGSFAAAETLSGLHFGDLLGRDADRPVQGHACAREQRREQVALVTFGVGQETPGLDGTASLAREMNGGLARRCLLSSSRSEPHIMMQLSSGVPSPSRRLAILFTM
jgi:hypothetical protein